MDKFKKLPVTFTVNDVVETKDSRFLAVTIDVLHDGLNFNHSIFNKDVVDACAESIKNTPILGYIAENQDGDLDYQAHEYDESGDECKYAGNAYGVIPESCNYRWTTKMCDDGEEREFFQVDGLLWTKFDDAVTIFEKDGGKPQSMELQISSIEGEQNEDGDFVFSKFKFEGCCLLSSTDETIQPAMINSMAVPTFSVDTMVQDIKDKLSEYNLAIEGTNKKMEDSKMPENKDFTLSLNQLREEMSAVLDEHKYQDEWGYECSRYNLVDIQDEEAIVIDYADHYRRYGLPYKMESDNVVFDFENAKRKKIIYVDFEESDEEILDIEPVVKNIGGFLSKQIEEVKAEKEAVEESYAKVNSEYEEMKPKYDAYVQKEQEQERTAIEEAKTAEFEKFDKHLSDNKKYAKLKEDRDKYSLEEIQRECAIYFTEKNLNADFAKHPAKEQALVGGVFEQKQDSAISSRYGVLRTE